MVHYVDRVYYCPDIRSQLDENVIHEAMTSAPEIDTVRVDIPARKVYIRMAEAVNEPDIIRRLSNVGFPIGEPEE